MSTDDTDVDPAKPDVGRSGKTMVVDDPQAIWHLSRMRAYSEASQAILAAMDEKLPKNTHERRSRKLAEDMNDKAQKAWAEFARCASANEYENEMIAEIGIPDDVRPNVHDNVVVLTWNSASNGENSTWGVFEVRAQADRTDRGFQLTTPFREVQIDRLPEGTQLIRINDPRHAATAALSEIFEMIIRDIESFCVGLQPEQIWQRMRYQAMFYQKVVRISVETLPDDEYRSWEPSLPERINIKDAPAIIARLAATSRAQQILAMHIAARFYLSRIDSAEQGPDDDEEARWVKQVSDALSEARRTLKDALEGYNAAIMAFANIPAQGRSAVAIMRPRPRSLPLLAIVPRESVGGKVSPQEMPLPNRA